MPFRSPSTLAKGLLRWFEDHPVLLAFIPAAIATIISLQALSISKKLVPADTTPLEEIVRKEATLTKDGNVSEVVELFTDDAVIIDEGFLDLSGTPQHQVVAYIGIDRIRERYTSLKQHAKFSELVHHDVNALYLGSGNTANATSSTYAVYTWDNEKKLEINTIKGESWSFVLINSEWKVKDLRLNMPPARWFLYSK